MYKHREGSGLLEAPCFTKTTTTSEQRLMRVAGRLLSVVNQSKVLNLGGTAELPQVSFAMLGFFYVVIPAPIQTGGMYD